MGQSLLFTIAAATLVTAGVLAHITTSTQESQQLVQADGSKLIARDVAFTGLSIAKKNLLDVFENSFTYDGPASVSGSHNHGDYAVSITASDSEVVVQSTSEYNGMQHTLVQQFLLTFPTKVPPFMENAITCGKNLNINTGIALGEEEGLINASVFANGKLHIDNTATIEGFGYYGDENSLSPTLDASIFDPNDNPDGLPMLQEVDDLLIPVFDAAHFKERATQVTVGQTNLGGTYSLGTRDEPMIWYIDGNLSTQAPVTFQGYGVIVVEGKVNLSDDFIGDYAGGESAFGLYASQGITVSAKVTRATGQWLSNSNITFSQGLEFSGSITVADNNCNFAQPFTMSYVEASDALTKDFWKENGEVLNGPYMTLIRSQEW